MGYRNAFLEGLTPDPDIDYLEWANRYFYLPRESSNEYGKYRSSRTPVVEEILLELSPNNPTEEVVVMKPAQYAGTTAGVIFMLASIDVSPAPGLLIEPTGDLARSFSKKKLQTALEATIAGSGRLSGKVHDARTNKTSNTILEKTFPGGSWRMAGSNSPAVYRGESVRNIFLDDFDGFDSDIGGEGDPGELADRRTNTFPNRKIYKNSTPTIKGMSNIEKAYEKSSQGRFNVPCPHCGHMQYLVFPRLKFKRNAEGEVTESMYQCAKCNRMIEEYEKDFMLANGKYVHRYPKRKIRGFQYNALLTPLGWINSWNKIAQAFVDSKGNAQKRQVWANTLMAETYELDGLSPPWEKLLARCEQYKVLTIPMGGYFLTVGVDVQDDRLAVIIYAWGDGEENWLVYWGEIHENPAHDKAWEDLDDLINRPFPASHAGGPLHVISVAVDTGGHHTQRVYDYCRKRAPRVFAIKGSNQANRPILGRPTKQDVTFGGKFIKNGVSLWPIGTDTAKSMIYSRMTLIEPGPGYSHYYIGLDDDFFMQLTAEKLITKYHNGYPVLTWVLPSGRRNEVLDCTVYAYAAALRAGLKRVNWTKLRQKRLSGNAAPASPPTRNETEERDGHIGIGQGAGMNYDRPKWLDGY